MPERLIDIPLESLPHVDERFATVNASPETTWDALLAMIGAWSRSRSRERIARALGCTPATGSGEPGEIGSTVPGFIVSRAVPPAVLALMGEHRFSHYALVFRIAEQGQDRPLRVGAETRAEFPGALGTAYRSLAIGSRGHALAVASMLRTIKRRAERSAG